MPIEMIPMPPEEIDKICKHTVRVLKEIVKIESGELEGNLEEKQRELKMLNDSLKPTWKMT